MSILTYKMIAKELFHDLLSDDVVDWAIELLDQSIFSELIFETAGLNKPVDSIESDKYRVKILDELKLNKFSKDEVKKLCYRYLLLKIVKSENTYKALKTLYSYTSCADPSEEIFTFNMLYWAWDELNDSTYSDYWPSATTRNIQALVIENANQWLEKNQIILDFQEKYFQ